MGELQAVIEGLAERLQRAVAVDDPSIRLLAHTAHDDNVDEHRVQSIMKLRPGSAIADYVFGLGIRTAAGPVRIPGRTDLRALGRLCIPVRCQGVLLGYLWLIDDDQTLTEEEIQVSVAAADAVGAVLFRERLLDDLRRAGEHRLLFELINPDTEGEDPVSQANLDAAGLTEQLRCRVVVVHAPVADCRLDTDTDELALEMALRRHIRAVSDVRSLIATRRRGRGYLLVGYPRDRDPLRALRGFGSAVCADLADQRAGVVVGIGAEVEGVRDARSSFQRAQGAVDVCAAIPEFAPVAAWEDLGVYRILAQLPLHDVADVAIPPGLAALLASESDQWLVSTLDAYLDAAGNAKETAARLHIHRATLYYRLSRIEEITGMSLADGQDRLVLHLGTKLGRLLGVIEPAGGDGRLPNPARPS